jgi:ribulose-5-phosphate 4-epimerase/fuculose-1-phosphate aldolase
MDDLSYAHLSVRSSDGNSFYIYLFGLLFAEITSSSLLEVDFNGTILHGKEYQYKSI